MTLIGDRTDGYILITSTSTSTSTSGTLDEPSQWRAFRSVARRAGLPQANVGPRSIKHSAINHALDRPARVKTRSSREGVGRNGPGDAVFGHQQAGPERKSVRS
ncbi:hypothetical protein [Streptomyces sp. NBC_00038]|uniref:hypothetical protein n=1 Tax=Streptomyces sp. NBC_00038 TaxID=2903615 RepID=UPI00224CC287|nr:hypothetical protein [Streptomyces sp. NBC_00038]MCX5562781.1 hypothetical protein [Streptomyces sp. NBC_00038]